MTAPRVSDGGRCEVEIPSVDGLAVMRAVLEEDVPVRHVSQRSGVLVRMDPELDELAALGAAHGVDGVDDEGPDDQGGFVRMEEAAELIRRARRVDGKLGLQSAPTIDPAGPRLADIGVRLGRERVRRAEPALRLVAERAPVLVEGRGADAQADPAMRRP